MPLEGLGWHENAACHPWLRAGGGAWPGSDWYGLWWYPVEILLQARRQDTRPHCRLLESGTCMQAAG